MTAVTPFEHEVVPRFTDFTFAARSNLALVSIEVVGLPPSGS